MLNRETTMMLRWPLCVLLVALLAAAAAITASWQYKQSQSILNNQANASIAQARVKLKNTQVEEKNLQTYSTIFNQLSSRGLFSEEKRLDWLENLKQLAAEHHFITLEFDLEAQRTLPAAATSMPNIDVLASPLQMKISAWHEEDLLNFFNALRNQPKGFYHIDRCNIKRADIDSGQSGANISADCSMEWISFKPKKTNFNAS
jgi:hypothetical protein